MDSLKTTLDKSRSYVLPDIRKNFYGSSGNFDSVLLLELRILLI